LLLSKISKNQLLQKTFFHYNAGKDGQMSYGRQRVWGSIGFGITAFMTGYAMDWWSIDNTIKSYTPAFVLIFIFSIIDLLCCLKLQVKLINVISIL
jgi:hypothetical protein